mmetsp:Transcript_35438/g.70918  ORF Transcript_35438/g.70918 Transcript_35438/m.70918 type:complete len:150 (-) Transcript_35438:195-644(-)
MDIISSLSLRKLYSEFFIYGSESTEKLRSRTGFDLEISDRLILQVGSFPKTKFLIIRRAFSFGDYNFLKNKGDLLNFIKGSQEGLILVNIISTYKDIKKDLVNLVKFQGKERKLILLKGKNFLGITLFSFDTNLWVSVSQLTVQNWHTS